jgi:hypothetical protein
VCITKDIYDTKASLLKQKRISIDMAIQDHQAADDTYKITMSSVFTLASEAFEIFKSSTTSDSAGAARANNHQKRKLIGFLFCLAAPFRLAALQTLNLPALRLAH